MNNSTTTENSASRYADDSTPSSSAGVYVADVKVNHVKPYNRTGIALGAINNMNNELNVRINTIIEKYHYELMASVNSAIEKWYAEEEERKREDEQDMFFLVDNVLHNTVLSKYNPITNEIKVYKGSSVREGVVPSMENGRNNSSSKNYKPLRDSLIENGVIAWVNDKFVLTRDYTFSYPSAAASVLLGRPANGRYEFINLNGVTLNEVYPSNRVSEDTLALA